MSDVGAVAGQTSRKSDVPVTPFPFSGLQSIGPVYAFLDLEHPAVAWAVMRGMLVSASHASAAPGFISFLQAGMIAVGNNARIFNEMVIELYRAHHFPQLPSRMRSMYFFGSPAEAETRVGDKDWPSYFNPANLIALELYCDECPTIVDANWITFADVNDDGRIPVNDLGWVAKYWRGEQFNETPVWEVLANGVALVMNEATRRQCDAVLEEMFPRARSPKLMARFASEGGTRGGQVHPSLLRRDEKTVELAYLWSDAEFHDPDAIEAMKSHPDFGKSGSDDAGKRELEHDRSTTVGASIRAPVRTGSATWQY